MAAVGIVGLVLSFAAWGLGIRTMFGKAMSIVGLATLGLGIVAAIVGNEGSEVLLAVFVGGLVVLWAVESMFHAGLYSRGARTH
jgi:hypothetical protein